MVNANDPPRTLAAAEEQFRTFLVANGYPSKITWLFADDFLIDKQGHRWIRKRRDSTDTLEQASTLYARGLGRNEGITFTAECNTDTETFATIYIPIDADDAKNRLIGRCLKCSFPERKPHCSLVVNPMKWFFLRVSRCDTSSQLVVRNRFKNKDRTQQYFHDWWGHPIIRSRRLIFTVPRSQPSGRLRPRPPTVQSCRRMPQDGSKHRIQNRNRDRRHDQPHYQRVPNRGPQQVHRIRRTGMEQPLDLGSADAQTASVEQHLA